MQRPDPALITHRLMELRVQHRALDIAISRLAESVACDELPLKRMKKRKLALKDSIARLESLLIPNLDA